MGDPYENFFAQADADPYEALFGTRTPPRPLGSEPHDPWSRAALAAVEPVDFNALFSSSFDAFLEGNGDFDDGGALDVATDYRAAPNGFQPI
jgi:hypothetical protein